MFVVALATRDSAFRRLSKATRAYILFSERWTRTLFTSSLPLAHPRVIPRPRISRIIRRRVYTSGEYLLYALTGRRRVRSCTRVHKVPVSRGEKYLPRASSESRAPRREPFEREEEESTERKNPFRAIIEMCLRGVCGDSRRRFVYGPSSVETPVLPSLENAVAMPSAKRRDGIAAVAKSSRRTPRRIAGTKGRPRSP